MGSAVTPEGITAELEAFKAAGFGGVEITPIYGVRGTEDRFVPYLSPGWVRLLEHTLAEAQRIGLGADMATGTGWPFGGPWVGSDDACRNMVSRIFTVRGGERLRELVRAHQAPLLRAIGGHETQGTHRAVSETRRGTIENAAPRAGDRRLQLSDIVEPVEANRNLQALAIEQVRYPKPLPLQTLMAYSDGGEILDLTERVSSDGTVDWVAPAGSWTLYAIFVGWHGKLVERAAPGGEGNVIDHFAVGPIRHYLARFDTAFGNRRLAGLRAFFNDSYEVDDASGQADWTPTLLEAFRARRGYDLRRHLAALFGKAGSEENARVLADYRETMSDLLLDTFTVEWRAWAASRGAIVRNQAHGSPANLLDLYAASDIPETEGTELPRFKWASSAAHVSGRQLIAAEAGTWLNEHFRSSLADIRRAVDELFLGGVNHIVYHGTNYSPTGDEWPGWLFYAAVHMNRRNSWWADVPTLNDYVARVQSFLQTGRSDHDVLLYYPEYDVLTVRSERGCSSILARAWPQPMARRSRVSPGRSKHEGSRTTSSPIASCRPSARARTA
jgi:alpha-L-rhamnosidase